MASASSKEDNGLDEHRRWEVVHTEKIPPVCTIPISPMVSQRIYRFHPMPTQHTPEDGPAQRLQIVGAQVILVQFQISEALGVNESSASVALFLQISHLLRDYSDYSNDSLIGKICLLPLSTKGWCWHFVCCTGQLFLSALSLPQPRSLRKVSSHEPISTRSVPRRPQSQSCRSGWSLGVTLSTEHQNKWQKIWLNNG